MTQVYRGSTKGNSALMQKYTIISTVRVRQLRLHPRIGFSASRLHGCGSSNWLICAQQ